MPSHGIHIASASASHRRVLPSMSENKNATVPEGRAAFFTVAGLPFPLSGYAPGGWPNRLFAYVASGSLLEQPAWRARRQAPRDFDVEGLEELCELVADGVRATSKLLGNVRIALALAQQREHFAFRRRDALERNAVDIFESEIRRAIQLFGQGAILRAARSSHRLSCVASSRPIAHNAARHP